MANHEMANRGQNPSGKGSNIAYYNVDIVCDLKQYGVRVSVLGVRAVHTSLRDLKPSSVQRLFLDHRTVLLLVNY